ncbi:hypothetical protein [Microvirga subterranea]|uniref:hypothetical protein n=1 Tax=Microvirga subterranea TaxID=186651 RepID=UPI0011C048C0|nr:hypothetical protein [Microvirga subterranea]
MSSISGGMILSRLRSGTPFCALSRNPRLLNDPGPGLGGKIMDGELKMSAVLADLIDLVRVRNPAFVGGSCPSEEQIMLTAEAQQLVRYK